jgi:hypothetical protein
MTEGTQAKFILAGSAVPADEITRHSGAGRISRLQMRPMSLFEAGSSSGEKSLGDLMAGKAAETEKTALEIPDIAEEIARGGWPALRPWKSAPQ